MTVPEKIKKEVEKSPHIAKISGLPKMGENWKNLTRTVYERVARRINQEVTRKVIENPVLISDFLLFGEYELNNIRYKYKIENPDEFIVILKGMSHQRPYNWISGKTLQSYWNGGSAKDKKINVLLTFLGIDWSLWDDYKALGNEVSPMSVSGFIHQNGTLNLIRKHFLGHYYRYYQKSNQSPVLVKAPFVILEDVKGLVKVETRTIGHRYNSSYLIIRDGALYIECENMDWNEKETYIFNVGFESNPKVIMGVSNTVNKKGQAIALKNVLVKQNLPYDYKEIKPIEIPFDEYPVSGVEEQYLISFFKRSSGNVIITDALYSLEELGHTDLNSLAV